MTNSFLDIRILVLDNPSVGCLRARTVIAVPPTMKLVKIHRKPELNAVARGRVLHLNLPHPSVSENHAVLNLKDLSLVDLRSSNGTRLILSWDPPSDPLDTYAADNGGTPWKTKRVRQTVLATGQPFLVGMVPLILIKDTTSIQSQDTQVRDSALEVRPHQPDAVPVLLKRRQRDKDGARSTSKRIHKH